jgi:hypothetical protein
MAGNVVSDVNNKLISAISSVNFLNVLGWIVLAIICIGAIIYLYIWWTNKRLFNKKITDFEVIGGYYQPTLRDLAKVSKIGSGGFQILFLKKLKTWRLAYGGRVGKNDYYFFILPDGYAVNGILSGDIKTIDKNGGLVQVITTNPMMRAQYTALEKQIDSLHSDKKSFMDKYGTWVMGLGFVLVAGVMLWLCFKEFSSAMGAMNGLVDKESILIDRVNQLLGNTASVNSGGNGLVPMK